MTPRAELIHWAFAAGFLLLGLILLAETIVGREVFAMRRWRVYLWPSIAFAIGVLLWPVAVFFTNSTLHMLAHASWAEVAMLAGAIQLALVRGKLQSRWWTLSLSFTLLVSAAAFLIHEQNPWLFSRAAFLHHAIGWTLLVAAIFPLGQVLQPRRATWQAGFAMTWIVLAVMLFCDRDVAPIFGHLSEFAGWAAVTKLLRTKLLTTKLLVILVAALSFPGVAEAHATLVGIEPPTQARLDSVPPAVVLRFDQTVTTTTRAIDVFAADGRLHSGATVASGDGRLARAPLTGLERGQWYTVRWRATSSDGHTGSGVYTFGIGVTPPAPTDAYGAAGPTWTDDVARWAYFVALALLIGTIGLRLLVLREPIPERLSNRLYGLSALGGIATLNVGIAAFVMRAADALQLPFGDLLYGDLSPIATKTRFGIAFVAMTLGYAAVTALVLLAWILDRPRLLWPAFVVGLLFATGLSLSGHQGVEPNATALTGLADWLHLVAAILWVGGLVGLAVCVWPLAPGLRRTAFLGFSRIATVLVAVLVLAGTYLSIARLPAVSDLWSTGYGQALLVKIAIVCVALGWGAVHHFVVRPRLQRGDARGAIGRSLIGESSIAILVLLVAAVLVNDKPPAVEPARATQVAISPR